MASVPGWHYSLYHNDRLHCEFIGICRDFGGALIRDIVEELDTPLELVFEDLHCHTCSFHFVLFPVVSLICFCIPSFPWLSPHVIFCHRVLCSFHCHFMSVCIIPCVPCHVHYFIAQSVLSRFLSCILSYFIFFYCLFCCRIVCVSFD